MTLASNGTPNFSSMSTAGFMMSQSLLLPMRIAICGVLIVWFRVVVGKRGSDSTIPGTEMGACHGQK
jgi:hypothetical protein